MRHGGELDLLLNGRFMTDFRKLCRIPILACLALCLSTTANAGERKSSRSPEPEFPPMLPGGESVVTVSSPKFLERPDTIDDDVQVARTPPTVDFAYIPGQDYPGKPWSVWGDSLAVGGKYYTAVGDHHGPYGNAFVYEYDPENKSFRKLVDVKKLLDMPEGHYVPGKIHSTLSMGRDGRIYFSTHRGSTRVTTDEYHYKGDWIIACDPKTGESEVVVRGPVPKHCIPTGLLDPERLIFYGGTSQGAYGRGVDKIQFFAYDCANDKLLYSGPNGPSRAIIFARSTGRVYYAPGKDGQVEANLVRFDPRKPGPPVKLEARLGLRAATDETPEGIVYTVSHRRDETGSLIYAFNVKTETVEPLGPAAVGTQEYITSIDADPTGRYLYYIPGAHGGSEKDGSPLVQYDVKKQTKKVIAFLHPLCKERFDCTLKGTFGSAVDPAGDKVYITWNNSRGGRVWDSCLMTVVHIPESERRPD